MMTTPLIPSRKQQQRHRHLRQGYDEDNMMHNPGDGDCCKMMMIGMLIMLIGTLIYHITSLLKSMNAIHKYNTISDDGESLTILVVPWQSFQILQIINTLVLCSILLLKIIPKRSDDSKQCTSDGRLVMDQVYQDDYDDEDEEVTNQQQEDEPEQRLEWSSSPIMFTTIASLQFGFWFCATIMCFIIHETLLIGVDKSPFSSSPQSLMYYNMIALTVFTILSGILLISILRNRCYDIRHQGGTKRKSYCVDNV
jgi:hypothetical protein